MFVKPVGVLTAPAVSESPIVTITKGALGGADIVIDDLLSMGLSILPPPQPKRDVASRI